MSTLGMGADGSYNQAQMQDFTPLDEFINWTLSGQVANAKRVDPMVEASTIWAQPLP